MLHRRPLPAVTAASLGSGFAALKHRNYRLFFSGQLVSVTGTWMQTLAQSWLVLTLTSSALKLGLVNVLQFSPVLVFGLFAGVVADRLPRQRILVATQAISAALALTLAILTWADRMQLWHIYFLALCLGTVNAFDMPARQAFVGDMVSARDLPNAIALNSSIFNMGRLAGPAIAGLLLSAYGPAVCFTLNALSYVAVVSSLLLMSMPARDERRMRGRGLAQIREGLGYIQRNPTVKLTMMMVAIVGVFGLNFNVWVPLLAKQEFDSGARGFGLLMAALGMGALIGALTLAFRVRAAQPRRMIATATMLGIAELVLGAVALAGAPVPLAILVIVAMGFAMTSTMSMANTVVQSSTPAELRGRVMSVYMTLFAGSVPFGAALAGLVSDLFGTPVSVMLGGAVTLTVAAFLYTRTRLGAHAPVLTDG
jgi:MFS family permease